MNLVRELRRRWWLLIGAAVGLIALFGTRVALFVTDVWWYQSIGFSDVLWTLLGTRIGLAVVGAVAVAILVGVNLQLARRLAPTYRIPSPQEEVIERYRELLEPFARPLLLLAAGVVGLFSGLSLAPRWQTYLLWANSVDFGTNDPQFGLDLGWFVFRLPFWQLLNSFAFTALMVTVAMTAATHYLFGGIRPQSLGRKLSPAASAHLSVLLAALVAVRAWGYLLDRYLLSYSERGQVTGLSYTDVHANLPALTFLAVIAVVVVILFLVNVRVRGWLLPSAGVAIMLAASAVLQGIYPAAIQRLQVDPQELAREEPYISRNLEFTRFGFGLRIGEEVKFETFPAADSLPPEAAQRNERTLNSIRLWDPATLQRTYQQLQEFRPYYDFRDVDVDRYVLDGKLEQTMIAVREMAERELPAQAQTWQNRRLRYTHGFGLVASDVSAATGQGQPEFFVRDIPPKGSKEMLVENPRIYFGENPPEYSIVGTSMRELDYPVEGDVPRDYVYTGEDGVASGSFTRRLAFALRYGEPNFVLSSLIGDDSKVLFKRNIRERVEAVAPYLALDHDPYPVAVDGRIKWILDGYTSTDMLPYSERVNLGGLTLNQQRRFVPVQTPDGIELRERMVEVPGLEGRANYIRNSVKAVVDAYDGTVTLYVIDEEDPLIKAWGRVFPDKLTPVSNASEDLRAHFRYPEDMFRVQAALFQTYHIALADEFYTKEDAWEIPPDATSAANQGGDAQPMRPYYLLMRLPGEESEEFALIQPFTPARKNNLTGWLAGRSDGEHYGQLKAFVMPPDRTVFGPLQIQARVNQDARVAEQITLWNQSGSRVIYGNLLVIPVEDSLLYAQPLFLRAETSEIPELNGVVLILGDDVVMGDTLADALRLLFGESTNDVTPPGATPPPSSGVDPDVRALIDRALGHFDTAERALRNGDLATYQKETRAAEEALRQAQTRSDGEQAAPPEGQPDEGPAEGPEEGAET